MRPDDKGGMAGYVAPVTRKKRKGKGKGKAKGKAKAKPSISRSNPYDVKRPAQNPEIRTNNPAAGRVSRRSADAYPTPKAARSTNPFMELARSLYSYPTTPGVGDSMIAAARSLYSAGNPNFKDGKRVPTKAAKPKGGSAGGRASSQRGKKK